MSGLRWHRGKALCCVQCTTRCTRLARFSLPRPLRLRMSWYPRAFQHVRSTQRSICSAASRRRGTATKYRSFTSVMGSVIGLPIVPKRFCIDEASMVTDDVYCDLLAKELPCFWLGDAGQLPPVGSDPRIMERAHVSLTKIHRQSLDSGILRIAHDVREGGSRRSGTLAGTLRYCRFRTLA